MKKDLHRPVLMGLAIATSLISALAAASDPAHAASNTPVPAAPSNLGAQAAGTTSIQLTWVNNAGNQSGVVISLDGEQSVNVPGTTVSSYTWSGLSPNTRYWFYVASKIYGTPGDPTGYGNTQSAWVGPVYATTGGTPPSTSPAPQPSTSPAPQSPTVGSGVPATLPAKPSPTFVCVTGPGGSCLQPGAGLKVPKTWNYTPPGWLTSPITGGCFAELTGLDGIELFELIEQIGGAIQFDESNGNFFVRLAKGLVDSCSQLTYDLVTGKPIPQNLDFTRGTAPQNGTVLASSTRPASPAAAPGLFRPVPKSQLTSMENLPFLRQRFGYAVAEVGAVAALSQNDPAGWGAARQRSVVCRPRQGGYRCAWSYRLNGAPHAGYVLVEVTAGNYRLGKVAQTAPAHRALGLSPLGYISIAEAVVLVAIVVALLRRRRRAGEDTARYRSPRSG